MFQNGLLATFIPEILMVIAFVACLFGSHATTHTTDAQLPPTIVNVSQIEQTTTLVTSIYHFNSHYSEQVENSEQASAVCPVFEYLNFFPEFPVCVTDGLS